MGYITKCVCQQQRRVTIRIFLVFKPTPFFGIGNIPSADRLGCSGLLVIAIFFRGDNMAGDVSRKASPLRS